MITSSHRLAHLLLIAALTLGTPSHAGAKNWMDSVWRSLDIAKQVAAEGGKMAIDQIYRGKDRVNQEIEKPLCRNILLGIAGSVILTSVSIAYYNWDYREGKFNNLGDEAYPVLMPAVGATLNVDERITRFNWPHRRSLWVNSEGHSFGRVFFEDDRIVYMRGKQEIASSGVVSPFGRPLSEAHPIIVPVFDTQRNQIGSVHEISTEEGGVYAIRYEVRDANGALVGSTETVKETYNAEPVSANWRLTLTDKEDRNLSDVSRAGWWADRYKWNGAGDTASSVDPRLKVIFAAYVSYVRDVRSEQ